MYITAESRSVGLKGPEATLVAKGQIVTRGCRKFPPLAIGKGLCKQGSHLGIQSGQICIQLMRKYEWQSMNK
jgi:hypothetical protein